MDREDYLDEDDRVPRNMRAPGLRPGWLWDPEQDDEEEDTSED